MPDEAQGTGSGGAGDGERPDVGGPRSPKRSQEPGSREPGGRDPRDSEHGESPAAAASGRDGVHGAYAQDTPEQLLSQVGTIRRRARLARHAYWFPLVLFGLLTFASIPFYIQRIPERAGDGYFGRSGVLSFLGSYLGNGSPLYSGGTAYYWLAAVVAGTIATALWYRWRGDRVGLRTPARGYVITGAVLLLLALGIPALAVRAAPRLMVLMPGDLLIRGTFPFVIIAIGLCVLAWAERSIALTVIAACYLALSLVASLYDIENVFYRLGWNLSPSANGLPNVVLPALVLLLSGAGAWVVQRRHRALPAEPSAGQAA